MHYLILLESDPEFLKYLHRNIAEYFLGTWSESKQKPMSYEEVKIPTETSSTRLTFDKPIVRIFDLQFDRLVPSQPIKYSDFHTNIKSRYNLRKLSVLPYHLLKADMIEGKMNLLYLSLENYSGKVSLNTNVIFIDFI